MLRATRHSPLSTPTKAESDRLCSLTHSSWQSIAFTPGWHMPPEPHFFRCRHCCSRLDFECFTEVARAR